MNRIDDLADVFGDLPRVACLELAALAFTICEEESSPLLAALRTKRKAAVIVPEDVMEELDVLLDANFSERPLAWHVGRAVGRVTFGLEQPRLRDSDVLVVPGARVHELKAVLALAPALFEDLGRKADGFLFPGLLAGASAGGVPPELLAHIESTLDNHALDFLARSRMISPRHLSVSLLSKALAAAFETMGGTARVVADGEIWEISSSPATTTLAGWVGEVLKERPDALALLGAVQRPLPRILATEIQLGDGLPSDYNRLLGAPWRGPRAEFAGGDLPIDLWDCRFPEDATRAADALLALLRLQPHYSRLGWRLFSDFGDGIPKDRLVALAASGPNMLLEVAGRVGSALAGAAALVSPACAIIDPVTRAEILVRIGPPAAEALVGTVDVLLQDVDRREAGQALVRVADHSPALNLGFWEKRLSIPGAFEVLCRSRRLNLAWTLRPAIVARAARKLAKAGAGRSAVHALFWIFRHDRTLLAQEEATVLRAILGPKAGDIDAASRVLLLGVVGTPAALAAADHLLGGLNDAQDIATAAGVHDDHLWARLRQRGLVSGASALRRVYVPGNYTPQVTPAAARDIAEEVITSGLGEVAEAAAADPHRLAEALFWTRTAEEAAAIDSILPRFAAIEYPDSEREEAFKRGRARERQLLDGLLEVDQGELLPEIGLWVADRYLGDAHRINAPEILGNALRARCRGALGDDAEPILAALGSAWATRSRLVHAAEAAGCALPDATLDKCADEGVPPLFRVCLAALPADGARDRGEMIYSDAGAALKWILEEVWAEDPELVARHLLGELASDRATAWLRGVAAALVALREPVGTAVPDAITRFAHEVDDADLKAFLLRQRDTFARDKAEAERAKPAQQRTRQAMIRLQRAARAAAGESNANEGAPRGAVDDVDDRYGGAV